MGALRGTVGLRTGEDRRHHPPKLRPPETTSKPPWHPTSSCVVHRCMCRRSPRVSPR
jgi:hypothetical protein